MEEDGVDGKKDDGPGGLPQSQAGWVVGGEWTSGPVGPYMPGGWMCRWAQEEDTCAGVRLAGSERGGPQLRSEGVRE